MSEKISPTMPNCKAMLLDNAKLQKTENPNLNNEFDQKTNESVPSVPSTSLGTETVDKTPISSAATFNELHQNQNEDGAVSVNECFETTEPTENFNETECVKFAEKLYKIVEELRIGRISDKENELRIQNLMSKKNDLERLKDDESLKKQKLIDKHSLHQDDMRRQMSKDN